MDRKRSYREGKKGKREKAQGHSLTRSTKIIGGHKDMEARVGIEDKHDKVEKHCPSSCHPHHGVIAQRGYADEQCHSVVVVRRSPYPGLRAR
jgi:hypothetical protein